MRSPRKSNKEKYILINSNTFLYFYHKALNVIIDDSLLPVVKIIGDINFHKLINSDSLDCVSNIAIVALYPKNQPFAVPGLRKIVLPTFIFSNL